MIITGLLIAIVVLAFFQPNAPRFFAALIFVGITLSHELFLSNLDGLQYYGSAALFDLAIIILTSGINPVPKMVINLHRICIVSIIANLVGWVLWFLYVPPLFYDASFVLIYVWTLITLIHRNRSDVGGYTLDSWATCLRFNRYSWYRYSHKHGGEV